MINFPLAKINLGLNVVSKRPDGYHDLETVFYPVAIRDALEVFPMDLQFPSSVACDLKVTNITIEGEEQKNLVVKAYNQLAADSDYAEYLNLIDQNPPVEEEPQEPEQDNGFIAKLIAFIETILKYIVTLVNKIW